MKKQNIPENVGLVWYTEEEWKKMKEISVDKERLEDSFKEWEKIALKAFDGMRSAGLNGKKVYVKTNEFVHWCRMRFLPFDAASRSEYVSEIMLKNND